MFTKDVNEIMKNQDLLFMLFEREEFYMKKTLKNHIIIFGHTPAFLIKAKLKQNIFREQNIWKDNRYNDKICIDCGISISLVGGRLG